jgi:hypothetical protein
LVGDSNDPTRLDEAKRVAEAQVDLLGVRQIRLAIYSEIQGLGTMRIQNASTENQWQPGGELEVGERAGLGERLGALAKELIKVDRYERRALSRRKFAIRDLIAYDRTALVLTRAPLLRTTLALREKAQRLAMRD